MARALVTDPLLILADEPTGDLDSRTGEEVLDLLEQLHDANRTIVMVTHDRQVARHARRIVTFRDGHIVKDEAVSRATSPAADPEGAAGPRPCEAALVSGR